MEKLWTAAEVAESLGIGEGEVEALLRNGTLTGYRLGGRYLRFQPDHVRALKGTVRPQQARSAPQGARREAWPRTIREFVYFYDFYLVSAALLAVLVVYLIAVG